MNTRDSHIFFNNLKGGLPVADRAEGIYIHDRDGRRYIDGIGGMFVVTIGHGVAEIAEAMAEQAKRLTFANYIQFTHEPQERLADHIVGMAPEGMDRVFFTTSGSAANELALQIAREYHVERGQPRRHKFISLWHNYHGMTVGALSLSGNIATRRAMNMDPYFLDVARVQPAYCYQCPFRLTHPGCDLLCAEDLRKAIEQQGPDSIAGFVATPVIGGTGGAIVPPPDYFARIRDICDEYGILLIMDEVITGFGRLGTPFGGDLWGVRPDLITVAKTLTSGYAPLGAVVAHQRIWDTFVEGPRQRITLLSTYAGHPPSCAAGLAVLRYIDRHGLIERSAAMGRYLKDALLKLMEREPVIGDVRGEGLFLGIEFVADRETRRPFPRSARFMEKVVHAATLRGLIVSGRNGIGTRADGDHLTLAPPFVITQEQCDDIVAILAESLAEAKAQFDLQGNYGSGAV